jgi:RHS repeat-associated protein
VSYDGFGAPVSYAASHNGSTVYAAEYTRDSLGRLSQKTETLGGTTRVFSYAYDLAGRLSEVRQDGVLVVNYSYDPNGNRLSRTDPGGTLNARYDAQDRLLQYGPTTYNNHPNGERASKIAGGQTTTYQYEGMGNLTGVTLPDGTRIEYLLDAQDRRVGKRVNGTLVQAFLYGDGLRPIAELDGGGTVVSRFVYATGDSVPDYLVKAGVTYRIITDHLGSPRLVLDSATGQIVQRMDHDEFGRVALDTNPGFQPFGFAGGLYDAQTGLMHFGAREYDPETGRWTTKDPIGFAGGDGNLYAYVGNEPVNNVDPAGLCLTTVGLYLFAGNRPYARRSDSGCRELQSHLEEQRLRLRMRCPEQRVRPPLSRNSPDTINVLGNTGPALARAAQTMPSIAPQVSRVSTVVSR